MIGIFLDWLLGERCHVCGTRVFTVNLNEHYTKWCRGVVQR